MRLVIDCCIRGEASTTRRYYRAYLAQAAPMETYVLELEKQPPEPLDARLLSQRDSLCARREFGNPFFDLARQFQQATEILIAAPFWDLSFPAVLKAYLERIMVCGLTFGYTYDGRCVGYCQAKRLLYFSSCGGFYGQQHLGFEYVKALCGMLGIPHCEPYLIQGMDVDPSRRERILQGAIKKLPGHEAYGQSPGGKSR